MDERIVISMTSYPKRITNVAKSIFFLKTKQTVKPDEIHIWLSTEEFKNKENDLPDDLNRIIDACEVHLHWVPKNTFVHKRHEYFKIAKDTDLVFFIDDDVRYADNLIENVINVHKRFPDCIVCYNRYPAHIYRGKKIIYGPHVVSTVPLVNKDRWCGQSMIPAKLYPMECLSVENQSIRDTADPISDECWLQPWIVYYDIPLFHLNYGWGTDINPKIKKENGIVGFSHQKEANGLEKRDNWLAAVLDSIPKLKEKYMRLFGYGDKSWRDYCVSLIPKMKSRFKSIMGREPNLEHPSRFTDKLEWLKAYDSTALKTYCSDKILVRNYVKEKIGKDISVPLLGTYDTFADINFSKLPKDYVIKTNHGSGTNIIVRDGKLNTESAKKKLNEWMSKDWSWWGYEMHYVHIYKKILIEQYMADGHSDLLDYKFYCFNGTPAFCQIITDRHSNEKVSHYDMDWIYKPEYDQKKYNSIKDISKPKTFDEMKEYAIALSADFKFVRVDFYEINGRVYFGELTFIPAAAYLKYKNDNADFELGKKLIL